MIKKERSAFTFYPNYLKGAERASKGDRQLLAEIILTLIEYGVDGISPKEGVASDKALEAFDYLQSSIDTNKQKRDGGEKGRAKQLESFKVPTVEEVESYCKERQNCVDASEFVDFYTSKNWLVGKAPMKDWKAAVRTWEKKKTDKNYANTGLKKSSYEL